MVLTISYSYEKDYADSLKDLRKKGMQKEYIKQSLSSPPAGQSSVASPAAAAQVLEFEAVTGALAAEGQH